ncbi:684_t:CDS:2, partial [Gigaspora margarita]
NISKTLWKKYDEMRKRNKYKYRIVGRTIREGKEKIPTALIIDEERNKVMKIANEVKFEIETDMNVIKKIVDKINNTEHKKSEIIRGKLGHMINTVRVMKEIKEIK